MKRKAIRLILIFGIVMSLSFAVWASEATEYSYSFWIETSAEGYNSASVYKTGNNEKARVKVTDVLRIMYEGALGSSDATTNFIIIASDGTQISSAETASVGGTCYPEYYSASHRGAVILRANSTWTGVGYQVEGKWNPNY